ncbi:MAG: magnesium transporter [Elusimicrobia bacterium]|nr:magnesium transporter [Elusimicrobiota bacterium]
MNKENRIANLSATVLAHIKSKNINLLKDLLSIADYVDVLDMIEGLSYEHQAIVYRLLPKDKALFVFERLDTGNQQKLIRSFTDDAAIEIITELDPDERVRLFDEMPSTFVRKMLSALSPDERKMTSLLMGYAPQTAGRIMTPEYVSINRNASVAETLEKIKAHVTEKEMIYNVYITDDARKLEGVISLRSLWISDPSAKIEKVMQKVATWVSTDTDQEEVARLLQRLDWKAVPVVDKENCLVGIVSIGDAVDILEEEATEDMLKAVGINTAKQREHTRSSTLIDGGIWAIWKIRIPILMLVLIGGFIAGMIMEGFEEALESATMIAFFIPLVLDMGGSVGGQSTTIFARGFVLGHIKAGAFWKQFFKEAMVGLSIGAVVGFFAFFGVGMWLGNWHLALAVSLALLANCLIAASAGFLVPYFLIKVKLDQAAGSGPIITSIKDITGLLVYFGLITLFLRAYIS